MAAGEDWTRDEVEHTVDAYLRMYRSWLRGEPYVKRGVNRELQGSLDGRTIGSIDFKHGNISAVFTDLGFPHLEGYKPYSNYQSLVLDVVRERLGEDAEIALDVEWAVAATLPQPRIDSLLDILEDPPVYERGSSYKHARGVGERKPLPRRVNWLEVEARNAATGLAGEQLVLAYEDARLRGIGKTTLANRIEHVSDTQGDGLGYDVLSYEENGRERFIEVKSTKFSKHTPFFASTNEVEVSGQLHDQYHLYRVFGLRKQPRLFTLPGALEESCILEPSVFRATAR